MKSGLIIFAALVLFVVGVMGECGCLQCSKNLRVVSHPSAPMKVIYRGSPCHCPRQISYTVEAPVIRRNPCQLRNYEYQCQPIELSKPVTPVQLYNHNYQVQVPIHRPKPIKYLLGLVASPDRVVLPAQDCASPPPCGHPKIATFESLSSLDDDNVYINPMQPCKTCPRYVIRQKRASGAENVERNIREIFFNDFSGGNDKANDVRHHRENVEKNIREIFFNDFSEGGERVSGEKRKRHGKTDNTEQLQRCEKKRGWKHRRRNEKISKSERNDQSEQSTNGNKNDHCMLNEKRKSDHSDRSNQHQKYEKKGTEKINYTDHSDGSDHYKRSKNNDHLRIEKNDSSRKNDRNDRSTISDNTMGNQKNEKYDSSRRNKNNDHPRINENNAGKNIQNNNFDSKRIDRKHSKNLCEKNDDHSLHAVKHENLNLITASNGNNRIQRNNHSGRNEKNSPKNQIKRTQHEKHHTFFDDDTNRSENHRNNKISRNEKPEQNLGSNKDDDDNQRMAHDYEKNRNAIQKDHSENSDENQRTFKLNEKAHIFFQDLNASKHAPSPDRKTISALHENLERMSLRLPKIGPWFRLPVKRRFGGRTPIAREVSRGTKVRRDLRRFGKRTKVGSPKVRKGGMRFGKKSKIPKVRKVTGGRIPKIKVTGGHATKGFLKIKRRLRRAPPEDSSDHNKEVKCVASSGVFGVSSDYGNDVGELRSFGKTSCTFEVSSNHGKDLGELGSFENTSEVSQAISSDSFEVSLNHTNEPGELSSSRKTKINVSEVTQDALKVFIGQGNKGNKLRVDITEASQNVFEENKPKFETPEAFPAQLKTFKVYSDHEMELREIKTVVSPKSDATEASEGASSFREKQVCGETKRDSSEVSRKYSAEPIKVIVSGRTSKECQCSSDENTRKSDDLSSIQDSKLSTLEKYLSGLKRRKRDYPQIYKFASDQGSKLSNLFHNSINWEDVIPQTPLYFFINAPLRMLTHFDKPEPSVLDTCKKYATNLWRKFKQIIS